MNWTEKLKEDFNIETKRKTTDSTYRIVKEKLQEQNSCRAEVLYKVFTEMKNKNVEITKETVKKVNKLLSNLLTYLRKDYKQVEGFKLIETNNRLQMISK